MTSTKDANGPGKVAQQYDQVGLETARPLIVEFSAPRASGCAHGERKEFNRRKWQERQPAFGRSFFFYLDSCSLNSSMNV